MKFAAKYEILEPVTRGSVETFVARSIATDERVLVHIFECPEQRPDQPTVQWVLESFRAIAPDPAELVLATGRYSGTTYAYLATKLPGSAVLQAWVRSYEERQETEENAASPERASAPEQTHEREESPLPSAGGTEESTVIRGIKQPKVTTIIEALRLEPTLVPEASEAPNAGQTAAAALSDTIIDFGRTDFRPVEKVQQREPGQLPHQFSGSEDTPKEPAQAVPPEISFQTERPRAADPMDEVLGLVGEIGPRAGMVSPSEAPGGGTQEPLPDFARPAKSAGITGVFSLGDASQPPAAANTASGNQGDGKTGEFTRFFQGPFHGERGSQTPHLSPPSPPPQKQAGEFTEIFGNSGDSPPLGASTRESPVRDAPVGGDSSAMAHLFEGADPGSKIPETYERGLQQTEILERNSQKLPAFIDRASSSAPVSPEALHNSPLESPIPQFGSGKSWGDTEEAFALRSKADATLVFSAPEKELAEDSSRSQGGPSDFTRIISGGLVEPTPVEEPLMPPGSRNDFVERLGSAPGIFPAPPSPPAAPSPPQFQRPGQFPPTAAATPPAASHLGSVSPKSARVPWTLIIIINTLVIIAVVLVLYFALKH